MGLLGTLFIVGTVVLAVLVFFGMLGTDAMPLSCPRCHSGGDEDIAGQHRTWYVRYRGRTRCRSCHTWFKEHPNGTLVEDRDP